MNLWHFPFNFWIVSLKIHTVTICCCFFFFLFCLFILLLLLFLGGGSFMITDFRFFFLVFSLIEPVSLWFSIFISYFSLGTRHQLSSFATINNRSVIPASRSGDSMGRRRYTKKKKKKKRKQKKKQSQKTFLFWEQIWLTKRWEFRHKNWPTISNVSRTDSIDHLITYNARYVGLISLLRPTSPI